MDAERKLAAYRAAKERREKYDNFKKQLRDFFTFRRSETVETADKEKLLVIDENIKTKPDEVLTKEPSAKCESKSSSIRRRGTQALVFTSWLVLYVGFIKLGFGIIFLIVSALFGMYYNTRTGPRDETEMSAYSVFNRNCESIDGTLKAEQFEREIRFGAQSVH